MRQPHSRPFSGRPEPRDIPDPDQLMTGRCVACQTVMECQRRDTETRPQAFGDVPCAECPRCGVLVQTMPAGATLFPHDERGTHFGWDCRFVWAKRGAEFRWVPRQPVDFRITAWADGVEWGGQRIGLQTQEEGENVGHVLILALAISKKIADNIDPNTIDFTTLVP